MRITIKNIWQILSISTLLLSVSCSDFLDENPKSTVSSGNYYQTEAQAESNVNYLYRNGASQRIAAAPSAYVGSHSSVMGMLTGYFTNSYEGQEVVCRYSRLLTRQDHTNEISANSDGMWDNCFKAINVANNAIVSIPGIDMDEGKRNQLVAEAKFFRAFNYFYLVKAFGDVPLLLEPSNLDELYPERAPSSSIYDQIVSDLQDAIEVLPEKTFAANGHRISKYVAAMLLTDVYFYTRDYANAKTYAKMVIDSPHTLTTNDDLEGSSAYNKLRTIDDLNEVIYSQEYDATINDGGWWPTYAFTSSATGVFSTYSIFERVYGPVNRFLNVYEEDDLRIQPRQFFHWSYTNPTNNKTWTAPEGQAGCWYYFDEEAVLNTGRSTKDWNIYRLAEAYLDYAESIAQTEGVTPEAANYLAQIQVRANTEGSSIADIESELMMLSTQEFIEACWTERLREFPLEFKIWDDCVRTMKFPQVSESAKGEVTYVDLIGAQNAAGATFKPTDLVFPISLNELQRNPNLTQNEGYQSR
ncbi:RagB/SusD family nutrient uptake outer membrane protein [Sinomicrobium pectinilyticum]|uniref:RagB/SusD family nutrient uptake outer membrane protein n=1 Tax=Sinomicrobium pectinilyticum TaxID=1084421 RepID=A0A3N0F053_SINP1|nr:RagB/SusD family nutrient uptake outer membrane protein [Sinomicrobium pectinilyticum]RNL93474.1 RagB/SusD family nutrient uptake outer membrane protein [Sinomicrobium pectinilyticum]